MNITHLTSKASAPALNHCCCSLCVHMLHPSIWRTFFSHWPRDRLHEEATGQGEEAWFSLPVKQSPLSFISSLTKQRPTSRTMGAERVDGGDGREWKFSEIQDPVWHKRNMAGGKLNGIAMSKELSPFTYGDRASSGFQANDDDNNQPSSLANKLIFLAGGGYGDSKPIRSAVSSFLNLWARHGLLDPATSGWPKLGPRDSP